jgi:hypothetical protein
MAAVQPGALAPGPVTNKNTLTLNTRHATVCVTKCWTIIKQITNSTLHFSASLEFVSAECFLQKPANMETAWGVIWTVPISDFYKTQHQACSPFTPSINLFPLHTHATELL